MQTTLKKDFGLSPRELDVVKLLQTGNDRKEMAETLKISIKTIDIHLGNIRRKMKLTNVFKVRFVLQDYLSPKSR